MIKYIEIFHLTGTTLRCSAPEAEDFEMTLKDFFRK
jgi:hypothetical protein